MNKTKEELRNEILLSLSSSIGINTTDEGSIALAIVDALIDEIYLLYEEIEYMKEQSYISTSSGQYTELISELVNVERDEFESDDNLKLRATDSVYVHAGGNKIAIEAAANAVDGVAEIDYRPFGFGTGSFIIFVYPEPHINQEQLIRRVEEAIGEVVSEGIYFEVKAPLETPVDIEMVVQFESNLTRSERNSYRVEIEQNIRAYLNNLKMNDVLYVNQLSSRAMNVSSNILDVNIINYKVGGAERPHSNTYPANEERFISGNIIIN